MHTREKDLPQLPSTLGAQEMYQTQQELMKRQGNKLKKSYIELTPGTPVWVQHRQNTTWEPAMVVSQCTPNSYWIMQENGTEQAKVYRRTRSMLKIRSTKTEAEQTGYRNSQSTEPEKAELHTPAIPNMVRDCVKENSLENVSPDPVQSTLPTLILKLLLIQNQKTGRKLQVHLHLWRYLRNRRETHLTLQDLKSQQERTLESQPAHLVTFTCKDTSASGSVDYWFKMLNFELYVLYAELYR